MALNLPPCSFNCPVHTDVPGYLAAIASGNYRRAAALIRANNPFASVCSWVCPHPCEDRCRRGAKDASLSIRALKRFALEMAGPGYPLPPSPSGMLPFAVAVVGGGPAGLTAAWFLAQRGYRVTVFERQHEAGGHLYHSIPTYRLPRRAVKEDVECVAKAGVEIRTGVEVGRDVRLDELRETFHAIILAPGLSQSRHLNLPGFDHPDVLLALPFLQGANAGNPPAVGERVVVVGGGDVAMDVARTALRLGAREVRVVCLESREEMPAHPWEIEEALEEGVELRPGWGPVRAEVAGGRLKGLEVKGVRAVFDAEGRFNPQFEEEKRAFVPGETIILAIGQCADFSFLSQSEVKVDPRGFLEVDPHTLATSVPGIFACGEIATGPGPAVAAVASGLKAAAAVHRYLQGEAAREERLFALAPVPEQVLKRLPSFPRRDPALLPPVERRASFVPQELGYFPAQALREADRCLRCGLGAEVIPERCAACLTCLRVCPYGVPVVEGRARIPAESCQGCGICAAHCPAGAITVKGIGREDRAARHDQTSGGPPVVIYACQRTFFQGLNPQDLAAVPELKDARLVPLPTAGALDPLWLMQALEEGAQGIAVITCGEENCRHRGGAARVRQVLVRWQEMLGHVGLEPARLGCYELGRGGDPLGWLRNFVRRINAINALKA